MFGGMSRAEKREQRHSSRAGAALIENAGLLALCVASIVHPMVEAPTAVGALMLLEPLEATVDRRFTFGVAAAEAYESPARPFGSSAEFGTNFDVEGRARCRDGRTRHCRFSVTE